MDLLLERGFWNGEYVDRQTNANTNKEYNDHIIARQDFTMIGLIVTITQNDISIKCMDIYV